MLSLTYYFSYAFALKVPHILGDVNLAKSVFVLASLNQNGKNPNLEALLKILVMFKVSNIYLSLDFFDGGKHWTRACIERNACL